MNWVEARRRMQIELRCKVGKMNCSATCRGEEGRKLQRWVRELKRELKARSAHLGGPDNDEHPSVR